MQHVGVVTPGAELETLNGGNHRIGVVGLARNAEKERADRILRVDADKSGSAALVGVNDKVGEIGQPALAFASLFALLANVTSDCRSW